MSWENDDNKANRFLAGLLQEFQEYLRDFYFDSYEYDDMWLKFQKWRDLGMPSIYRILYKHKCNKHFSSPELYEIDFPYYLTTKNKER